MKLLDAIGANKITPGNGGADVAPLMRQGVPVLGFLTNMEHYFDWHHTNADTLDKWIFKTSAGRSRRSP